MKGKSGFVKKVLYAVLALLILVVIGIGCFLLGAQGVIDKEVIVERVVSRQLRKVSDVKPEAGAVVTFVGYVRGRSMMSLKNKYAGFVSKVYVYRRKVKKGDVILEYDDLPLRTSIRKLEHSIEEQRITLERKKLNLTLTRLDPLPSEYRNLVWKRKIAQENLERSAHEFNVYERLHGSKIVTDLAYMEKKKAYKNSEAEVKKMDNDMKILQKGLASLNITAAEIEVRAAETKLRDLEEELKLLKEEKKYYKIVAPFDSLCITNSDTVNGYDAAATATAEFHKDDRKLVYAYCPERYIRYIKEGTTYRFNSNQYPDNKQGFELFCYDVKKGRYQYGDESFFLVKLRVVKEPYPLRIGTIGTVSVEIPQEESSSVEPEPAAVAQ